ncbi:gene transfer agent family protein [Pontibaca methylaminivorans]|uniref:Phage tail tube protein, GTA-gp10 n=1 Tax=Pontibaca methylaminivorans TaxID=515897 RepID=A0A1R3WBP8_9RHOB|nr:gene transfer agent family protein [Pontibaca methylaminivorans]SIT74755.1 Phage tail tube protein, GTA-gp10 [Pontibaca methylaminivorans]
MSRNAETTLDWADGTYRFRLSIEQLAELQEKCGAGPWYIQWALEAGALARVAGVAPPKDLAAPYVTETIRLGLIGGGMDAISALKKVRAYCGEGQLAQNVPTAYAILGVALQGAPEDEPTKKPRAGKTTAKTSRAGKSGSRTFTVQDKPSA